MSTDSAARTKRTLKIQSAALGRLDKELKSYQNEVVELTTKRGTLVEDAADEYDIKNSDRMIEESKKMVKVTKEKLGKQGLELKELVTRLKTEDAGKEGYSEELQKATDVLEILNT